jgi:hypothetical protein
MGCGSRSTPFPRFQLGKHKYGFHPSGGPSAFAPAVSSYPIRSETLIETRRSKMSNKIYNLTVPVTFSKNGNDQTSFRRVGAVFENTRDNGETVLSIKLDFPVGVTELVAFPPKADGDDGQVTE